MRKLSLILTIILVWCTILKAENDINPVDYKFDFPDDYDIICSTEENYPRFEGVDYDPYPEPYYSCVIQNNERAFIYNIHIYGGDDDEINIPDYGNVNLYVFNKKIKELNRIGFDENTISFRFGIQDKYLITWQQRTKGGSFKIYDLNSLELIKEVTSFDYDYYFTDSAWKKYPKIPQRLFNDKFTDSSMWDSFK